MDWGWCTICLGVLYQPFTELVYGKAMLLDYSVVILFCIYFYILKMGDVRSTYSSACGLWWENRYRAVVEAVTNLTFNFILGKLFGIYGIIIATILSLFVCNFLWGSQIIFKYYFVNVSVKKYFKQNLFYGLMTSLIAILIWLLCSRINISGLKGLGIRIVICIAFPNMLYFLIYKNTYMYKETIIWLNEKIHFKLNNKVC